MYVAIKVTATEVKEINRLQQDHDTVQLIAKMAL